MSFIGINGFGRIGKCILLQLIDDNKVEIKCINSTSITISEIEDYLKYDTTHKNYNKKFNFEIISKTQFKINHHTITLVSDRNPKNIPWRELGCNIVIEATGSFLTKEKCSQHNVDTVIITSPAKDDTSTYIYGVNHDKYKGESVISASSCTSNCLAPMLHFLSNNYGIKNAIFTTIHASTASQNTVDVVDQKARTSRSIFNNIIPHSTGASSSILSVLPELNGKVFGTSVRVPVVNCSLLDLNVELEKMASLKDIYSLIQNDQYNGIIYDVNNKKLVSSDFSTTTIPCIIDYKSCIDCGNGKFKFMVWYDNEWSYSTQIIRLLKEVTKVNNNKKSEFLDNTNIKLEHFIENIDFNEKNVVCRFDYNVPIIYNRVVDDFRISSTIKTIQYILEKKPKRIVLVSHLGRPNGYEESKSLKIIIPVLENYLNKRIAFLHSGLSNETLDTLSLNHDTNIFLLENIRFHKEETNYENMSDDEINDNPTVDYYKKLGDVFICDAFGCMHRKHMSIHSISKFVRYGYGYLVKKEIEIITSILNSDKKKLIIIGGNKIKDKMPFIDLMKTIPNTSLFIGGKIATEYLCSVQEQNICIMKDGYGNSSLDYFYRNYIADIKNTNLNIYDIGDNSLKNIFELVDKNEIIFWNGSLGVIEHPNYSEGSIKLIEYLKSKNNKTIIIGGGDTSTLINKNGSIHVSTGGGALLEMLENISKNKGYLVGINIFS
jgi:glyceraldehyde 3-phosphate dehydrogenase